MRSALHVRKLQRRTHMGEVDAYSLRSWFLKSVSKDNLSRGNNNDNNNNNSNNNNNNSDDRLMSLEAVEIRFREVLAHLPQNTFQEAVAALTKGLVTAMDPSWWLGGVDWGLVVAALGLLSSGPLPTRARLAFEALMWSATGTTVAADGHRTVPVVTAAAHLRKLAACLNHPSHPLPPDFEAALVGNSAKGENANASLPVTQEEYLTLLLDVTLPHLRTAALLDRHHLHLTFDCGACEREVRGVKFECVNVRWGEGRGKLSLCARCYANGWLPRPARGHLVYVFEERKALPVAARLINYITGWS
jgi:hypothetical protein